MARSLPPITLALVIQGYNTFISQLEKVADKYDEVSFATEKLVQKGSKSLDQFASTANTSALAVIGSVTAISTAVTAATAVLVKMGADYQQQIADVGAITNTSGAALEAFADHARDISREVPLSLKNIAKAGGELVRAGLTVEEAMQGATKAVAQLTFASAGELGLENAARMVAGGLLAFNLRASDAEKVANALTTAAVKSAVTFSDVDRSFRQSASVAAILGYTVEDLAATIGVLGQAFLRGSDAGTSLKQMFISMMKPSETATELMKKYRLSLYDSSGKVVDFRTLLVPS